MSYGRTSLQIGGRLTVGRNFLATGFHAGYPIVVLLNPVFEVFLRIEFSNLLLPLGQRVFDFRCIDHPQYIGGRPGYERSPASGDVTIPIGIRVAM